MKTAKDKDLKNLFDSLLIEVELENVSLDFTEKVMSKIEKANIHEAYIYKSVIPKFVFICFFTCFSLCLYLYETKKINLLFQFNFNAISNYVSISFLKLPYITIISVTSGTLVIFIQILLLKIYFNKYFKV